MDYKEVGMEIRLERWVGFVTDSDGNYAKARRLMNSVCIYLYLFNCNLSLTFYLHFII